MTHDILTRLARLAPARITAFSKPGPHCVMACTVGQMTLARFGIAAEPYPVVCTIANKAWLDWVASGHPGGRDEQQRRGAYLLTNAPNWSGGTLPPAVAVDKPWDGHLVLRVADGVRTWLLDLDLGAFNRPAHAIHLPGGVVAPLRADGTVSGIFEDGTSGASTSVEYIPLDAPYRDVYLTSRDWRERDRFAPHVDALVRLIGREKKWETALKPA